MIHYRHYPPSRLAVEKHYGVCFEWHPKRKGVDFFWGGHVYAFWIGRSY